MCTKRIKLTFLFSIVLTSFTGFYTYAQVTQIPAGILVKIKNKQVGIFCVNNAAFCLSANDAVTPALLKSIFIEPGSAKNSYTLVSAAPVYGIKTAFGKLVVNAVSGVWMLYDAAGRTLINDGVVDNEGNTVRIKYGAAGTLYGAGNKTTKALLKNQSSGTSGNGITDVPYLWSTDGYSALGVSANDNQPGSWQRSADNNNLTWQFKGKTANLYLWPAKTMYQAANVYVKLTGRPKLPPRWAFGYLQSQWGWQDSAYIANVAAKFREHRLPVDAFIIDFEWYTTFPDYFMKKEGNDGFNDFGFNPKLFPHPAQQLTALKKQGINFIGIRKPRLGNKLLLDTVRKNGWLNSPDNPDADRDLNFSNAGLRHWYGQHLRPLLNDGVAAWWNDEGESYYTCYYWWNLAQRDVLASARPNERHFSLNRAFSPGNQRFGYCTWTGDILSTWQSLSDVPRDLLNFSLSGMYYGSCDIGGFSGSHDPQPTKEMLVRWFEAGTFFPIMRSHSNIETTPRFPYLWGQDGEAAMRKALNLRYRLIPYAYSLAHEAYNTGAPIMRPLAMEFPADTAAANLTDEWLEGSGLLVAPVLNEGGKRKVYLPRATWYDFFTGQKITGTKTLKINKALDEVPVYVRAGTILPLGPVVQYTRQSSSQPLEIHVYPGENGTFNMVEDDGVSYNYTRGITRTTTYTWNDKTKTLTWKVKGGYNGKNVYRNIKAVVGKQERVAVLNQGGKVVFK